MKINYCILMTLFIIFSSYAQNDIKLKFNKKGEFKIVQFTDTHVDLEANKNLSVYTTIKTVIDIEKPDLVVLTGDNVTQNNPEEAYKRFSEIFNKAKIPWMVALGNHDSQHNLSREETIAYIESLPYCMNKDVADDVYGNSNFVLPISGKNKLTEALIYCLDSGDRSALEIMGRGYDWLRSSQIDWYRNTSKEYTFVNNGKPLPALVFFHIPLMEYENAWNNEKYPPIGVKNEKVSSPDVNSGMFTTMLEMGDIMGVFVGHDHINDYIGTYYNIALAYGRVTKIMRDPEEDPLAGGRVIVLKEGQRKFDTWIRDMNGKRELECSWPDSFQTENESYKLRM